MHRNKRFHTAIPTPHFSTQRHGHGYQNSQYNNQIPVPQAPQQNQVPIPQVPQNHGEPDQLCQDPPPQTIYYHNSNTQQQNYDIPQNQQNQNNLPPNQISV